jgi:hypothetical protein
VHTLQALLENASEISTPPPPQLVVRLRLCVVVLLLSSIGIGFPLSPFSMQRVGTLNIISLFAAHVRYAEQLS